MRKARSSREKSKHVNVFLFFFASSAADDIPFRYHVFALPWFHIIYIGRQKGMLTECKMLLLVCISRQMHFISRRELRKENHKPTATMLLWNWLTIREIFRLAEFNRTNMPHFVFHRWFSSAVHGDIHLFASPCEVLCRLHYFFKEQAKAVSDRNLSRPMWLIKRSGICV